MLIAHLADSHLGYRHYQRQTPAGINQREADVAGAFHAAVDGVIRARPDAVLIAGDLFHAVRPSNAAIVHAFRELQRLREALPAAPVVLIAGNHDTPRSAETGSILRLFEELGVDVATSAVRQFEYPALGLAVVAVPHAALVAEQRPDLRPAGDWPHRVLLLHGEVQGILPADRAVGEYGGGVVAPAELAAGGWSYVALGHYHIQVEVAPRVWYSGSLEYVSGNIWGAAREEAARGHTTKGWLLANLATGEVTRQPIPMARGIHDLRPIEAAGREAAAVNAAIREALAAVPGGLDDQIVRLVVRDIPRHLVRELDHRALREAKARALHLQVEFRPPGPRRATGTGAPGRRQSLPDLVGDFLRRRPLPADLGRAEFVRRGLALLAEPEG
jgi:hypothetical protein